MNKINFWLKVMSIIAYINCVVFCITLVFIPLGIYSYYGAKYYNACSKLTESELALEKQHLINWALYFAILAFPLGLFAIIPVMLAGDNEITINNEAAQEQDEQPTTEVGEAEQTIISSEDAEKLDELKKYLEQGLITKEEFEKAKKDLLK